MKKLLTITYTKANSGGVTYGVSKDPFFYRNGYALKEDVVKTILNRVTDFMTDFVPNNLIELGLDLEVYRVGKLILVIDKDTLHKSKRWLRSVCGTFKNEDFNSDDFNLVVGIGSNIITLPISLILNTSRIFIGLMESAININFMNILDNKNWRKIIFVRSRFHVEKLYLPVKENIYFFETFCASPKISFYYRDKKKESEKYYANMDIDKCRIKIKSELSIELDDLAILVISRLKYNILSLRTKADLKLKRS